MTSHAIIPAAEQPKMIATAFKSLEPFIHVQSKIFLQLTDTLHKLQCSNNALATEKNYAVQALKSSVLREKQLSAICRRRKSMYQVELQTVSQQNQAATQVLVNENTALKETVFLFEKRMRQQSAMHAKISSMLSIEVTAILQPDHPKKRKMRHVEAITTPLRPYPIANMTPPRTCSIPPLLDPPPPLDIPRSCTVSPLDSPPPLENPSHLLCNFPNCHTVVVHDPSKWPVVRCWEHATTQDHCCVVGKTYSTKPVYPTDVKTFNVPLTTT